MNQFMDQDFLLSTPTAKWLYHDAAEHMPIIDYHCHIRPEEIAENRRFENITEVWLGGDHYKWRQMRFAGLPEELITGNAEPREKFRAYCEGIAAADRKSPVSLEPSGIAACVSCL